jgi:hypothetical protein
VKQFIECLSNETEEKHRVIYIFVLCVAI